MNNSNKVLYCNVTNMENYRGIEENAILSGGKYVKEHGVGFELFNFKEIGGFYYGFVQPPIGNTKISKSSTEINKHKFARIGIENLGASKKEQFVDGINVIWSTTIPGKGRTIIGWYKNARVYREQQILDGNERRFAFANGETDIASYYIVCKIEDGILLTKDGRVFVLEKNILGQANIGYGKEEFNQKVLNYVNNYQGPRLYDKYTLKTEIDKEIDKVPDVYKDSVIKTRIGQSAYRSSLIHKFHGKCALCGVEGNDFLIASHIKPWKDCDDGEHLDENNGLLLCPNHDKVFDMHLISFDEDGKIVISKKLSKINLVFLNINENYKINVNQSNIKYLKHHLSFFRKQDEYY